MDDGAKRRLLEIISKIPLFQDLTLYQAEKILGLCRSKRYEADEVLCEHGTPSTEMFILLAGELGVFRDNALIATVKPISPVGEMGILTGASRTATVAAKASSSLLVIRRIELDSMMKRDPDIAMVVFKNFSQTLSQRLDDSNGMLEKHRHQTQELKRQVIEYRRRVEVLEQQVIELTQQVDVYKERLEDAEKGRQIAEPSVEGKPVPAGPPGLSEEEVVRQLVERHVALLRAKDYSSAYESLSIEAKHDVPWKEYERIHKKSEELGEIHRIALSRFELQHEEGLEYYYIKYAVDFVDTSGILELYVQKEDNEWKVSHEIVPAAGGSETV